MHARSYEVSLLQSPRAKPQAEAVVHEHLQAVRSAVQKHIRMMRARLAEHLDHASERGVYSGSHVQRLNGNPGGIDADHFMSARRSSAHSRACDAGHCKLTRLRPLRARSGSRSLSEPEGRIRGQSHPRDLALWLGQPGRIAMGASPRSASFTQRRKRFAFSPRANATAAIDTPGCWHSPTASALKNTLWCRRRRRPVVTGSVHVSTKPTC